MNQLSPRQRQFCELVAKGHTYGAAYAEAYRVEKDVARRLGSRLMSKAVIQSRVQELREPLVEDALLTVQKKRANLRQIIEANVVSLLGDDGRVNMDALRRMPPHTLESVTVTEKHRPDGTVVRIVRVCVPDKMEALKLDNKLAGHGDVSDDANKAEDGEIQKARQEAKARAREILAGLKPPMTSTTR